MIDQAAEIVGKAGSKLMYGGSAMAGGSWWACRLEMTGDDWTVLFGCIGAAVAVGGFLVNWRYKAAHLKLARELAKADLEE